MFKNGLGKSVLWFQGLLRYMKGQGDDLVSSALALMNHYRDQIEFSDVYNLNNLVKSKTLYGFDIKSGKSINNTAVAFKKMALYGFFSYFTLMKIKNSCFYML